MDSADKSERPYHHGDLRRALLDAALELIESEGVSRLSLRGVARRAGVSHAAPYHHFHDRRALMAAVAEEGFRALREAILARVNAAPDPRHRLRASGIAYVLFAVEHPAHFRMMFSAEVADKEELPSLRKAAEASYAVLREGIAHSQQAGLVRAGDADALSQAAWSLVHGLATLLVDGHFGPEGRTRQGALREAEKVTGVLWQGLRPE